MKMIIQLRENETSNHLKQSLNLLYRLNSCLTMKE